MIEKHGSEEEVRKFMKESNSKSARNKGGTGGFAYMKIHEPERLKEVSSEGGKRSTKTK